MVLPGSMPVLVVSLPNPMPQVERCPETCDTIRFPQTLSKRLRAGMYRCSRAPRDGFAAAIRFVLFDPLTSQSIRQVRQVVRSPFQIIHSFE